MAPMLMLGKRRMLQSAHRKKLNKQRRALNERNVTRIEARRHETQL